MRKLRVVVRTAAGTLPMVVAAQVSPGCGASHGRDEPGVAGEDAGPRQGDGTSGSGGSGGTAGMPVGIAGSAGAAGTPPAGSGGGGTTGGTGGNAGVGGFGNPDTGGTGGFIPIPDPPTTPGTCEFMIELPEPGTPAEPGQICAATMVPVDSVRAARVTLQHDPTSTSRQVSLGFIEVDPALQPLLVGTPTVVLLDATDPRLLGAQITMLDRATDGADFSVSWPVGIDVFEPDGMLRVTFRTVLELTCGSETQIVHSATDIHLCVDWDPVWVSAGDWCTVCRIIAEMAPSPIVPEASPAPLPLGRVVRLRVVELARASNTVVLLAENDGGADMRYEWHASGGEVRQLAPDVVAWSLEGRGPAPFIQAAVLGEHGAAVGTFAFNDGVC